MTTYTMKSPLDDAEQDIAGRALQIALVDLVDLSLVAKQIHWNLVGPRFRSLHLQLDDVVATARTYSDTVAERAAAIGVPPDGRASLVAADSALPALPTGWVRDVDAIDHLVAALDATITRLRAGIAETEKADVVTQDLLIAITAELEKHSWMFQAER